MASLKKDGLEKFVRDTVALVPSGMRFNSPRSNNNPGPDTILNYRVFIEIVAKFVREGVLSDVQDAPDLSSPGQFKIEFIGKTQRKVLNPKRVFVLSLNDALDQGIQPIDVRNFRKVFDIPNDKGFFQRDFGAF